MKENKNTSAVTKAKAVADTKPETPVKLQVAVKPEPEKTMIDANIVSSVDALFNSMVTRRPPALDFDEACKMFKFYVNNVVLKAVKPRYVCVLGKKVETLIALSVDDGDVPFTVDQRFSRMQPILINGDEYDKKIADAKAAIARKSHKKNPAKKDK